MTSVVYTKNYITQEQLRRAYAQLDHTPPPDNRWEATLLITPTLEMDWACRCLIEWGEEDHEGRPVADPGWHVISRAGELDWPPLRPHEEMWDAMLRRYMNQPNDPPCLIAIKRNRRRVTAQDRR